MGARKNIFFEIETINRELDFRLFLACLCAHANNRIFIGELNTILDVAGQIESGLYVGKNARPTGIPEELDAKRFDRYHMLQKNGHRLLWLDEEGAVFPGHRSDWERVMLQRLDPTQLAAEDVVCTWGDLQREFYLSLNPACASHIQTTGHPRFDLYKPFYKPYFSDDAERIRERFGDLVLINTNFHRANSIQGVRKIFGKRQRAFNAENYDAEKMIDRWVYTNQLMVGFIQLITRLSLTWPSFNFVIRPHPSENPQFYQNIFDGFDNVHVVHEESVSIWLSACRAMIHGGCTTAIEAHFLNVPVVTYRPVMDERFDIILPNTFGTTCTNEEQALECLTPILNSEGKTYTVSTADDSAKEEPALTAPNDLALSLIENFRNNAFDRLVPLILEMSDAQPAKNSPFSSLSPLTRWQQYRRQKSRQKRDNQRAKRREQGMQNKFYGFDNVALDRKMEKIHQLLNKEVEYTVISDQLISIEGKSTS